MCARGARICTRIMQPLTVFDFLYCIMFPRSVLVVHLQKLSVSTMGAGLLARDMKEYQRVISLFHLSAVLEKWAELRQLVDLFFVGVDYLRAVINDSSKLAKMPHKELLQWIQMRADFGENKRRILTSLNLHEDSSWHDDEE